MNGITANVWTELEDLAGVLGQPVERVGALRHRVEGSSARSGAPYTLLLGRPRAGLERLLESWPGSGLASKLGAAATQVLVVGPHPESVRPRLGAWVDCKVPLGTAGHLFVFCPPGEPPPTVLGQLTGLGYFDQLVLVTRLGQPLNDQERSLARALAPLAATGRVLVVALPGEDVTEAEQAEIAAYVAANMQQIGFDRGRCVGTNIWFAPRAGTPTGSLDLLSMLSANVSAVEAGRRVIAEQGIRQLLLDLCQVATAASAAPRPRVDAQELDGILADFARYLDALGGQVGREAQQRPATSAEALRAYALDMIRGWRSHTSPEGHWLRYVNTLCPGIEIGLVEEARLALGALDYIPADVSPTARAVSTQSFAVERVLGETKRVGVGIVSGLAAYLALPQLLDPLDPLFAPLRFAALGIVGVLGYGVARRIVPLPRAAAPSPREQPALPLFLGWDQVKARLLDWTATQLRATTLSPVERCHRLAARLGIALE